MEDNLFYDDDVDALKATVRALGGNKAVGVKVWPDKTPDGAGRTMADCCNPGRSERLSPSQLLFVMRLGRERGCHILAEHFMGEAGYSKPVPVDPKEEAGQLIQRMEDVMQMADSIATRMERLRNSPFIEGRRVRPAEEIRQALFDSALALTTPESSPTMLELAAHAQVGFRAARYTVDNMRRAGILVVVRARKVEYRNRPVAEYCPPARLEALGVKRCVLREVFASWATPIV